MAISKEDILGAIADMSVMQVVELIEDMEKKFNVTAAAAVAVAAPAAGAEVKAVEQDSFKVMLTNCGANKVAVIKEVRTIVSGLGLKEAKDLVEAAPAVVKEGVSKKEAEDIKKLLEAAGAAIEIK